ncbi:MAG: hypothetical protein HY536_00655 [Candidatus Colwellbacteria bacterium]|nr:hypothetical protein [Candidatus Colwellbacteria bacterium]
MRLIHRRLIGALRRSRPALPWAAGSLPGSSPLKALERHRGHRFIYRVDLVDAYAHVHHGRLAEAVADCLSLPVTEASRFLQDFFLAEVGLPQGAPASPELFNLYCGRLLDPEVGKVCTREGLALSRYLDDLIISGDHPISRRVRGSIQSFVRAAGFRTHPRKTKKFDLLLGGPVTLLGVRVSLGGVSAPLRLVRRALVRLRTTRAIDPVARGMVSSVLAIPDPCPSMGEKKQLMRLFRSLLGGF